MTMGANRYSRLIKNSSEEDLKLYIYIIESELGYRKGEVIDLRNMQKSNLQFKLGELIREKLDIEWKYLEGDDLTEYENEDLDDFINTLFLVNEIKKKPSVLPKFYFITRLFFLSQ